MRCMRREIRFELSIRERTSARWIGDERFGWIGEGVRIQVLRRNDSSVREGWTV